MLGRWVFLCGWRRGLLSCGSLLLGLRSGLRRRWGVRFGLTVSGGSFSWNDQTWGEAALGTSGFLLHQFSRDLDGSTGGEEAGGGGRIRGVGFRRGLVRGGFSRGSGALNQVVEHRMRIHAVADFFARGPIDEPAVVVDAEGFDGFSVIRFGQNDVARIKRERAGHLHGVVEEFDRRFSVVV